MQNLPRPSCPQGYTALDLERIFPNPGLLSLFSVYMTGQTMGICDGRMYEHNREHTGKCTLECQGRQYHSGFPRECLDHCNHDDGDDYDWKCDYPGGGRELATECADSPHGIVVYTWDVERYFARQRGELIVWD